MEDTDFLGNPIPCQISSFEEEIPIIIQPNQCLHNAYAIAEHLSCKMVEGVVIVVYSDGFLPVVHCWNKRDDSYFDLTKEAIWNNAESPEETPTEYRYFSCAEYDPSDARIEKDEKGLTLSFKHTYDSLLDYFRKQGQSNG